MTSAHRNTHWRKKRPFDGLLEVQRMMRVFSFWRVLPQGSWCERRHSLFVSGPLLPLLPPPLLPPQLLILRMMVWAWLRCWSLRRVSWRRSAGGGGGPGSLGCGRVRSHGLCGAPKTFSWQDVVVVVELQCRQWTVQMKIDGGDGDVRQLMSAGEWMLSATVEI